MLNTNITSFRKNVFSMLEQTIKYNEPLNISTKAGNAVVLSGALSGLYSPRITAQHRLLYEVVEEAQTITILSMWSHYERL